MAAAAAAAFVWGASRARTGSIGRRERRWFRAVNRLPSSLHVPVWTLMQAGSFGGVVASTAGAAAAGRPRLARRLAWVGTVTWLGGRAVKHLVQRQRPVLVVDGARILGREQRGMGYPSGHAAVAAALAATAAPALQPGRRRLAWVIALLVGPARMYVGAHLPLDVAGGVAFGLGVATATRSLAADHGSRDTPRSARSSWRSWRRE